MAWLSCLWDKIVLWDRGYCVKHKAKKELQCFWDHCFGPYCPICKEEKTAREAARAAAREADSARRLARLLTRQENKCV